MFPITRYRSFNDPFDRFFGNQLRFFDPWHDFDTFRQHFDRFSDSFRWINEPRRIPITSTNSSIGGNIQIPITNAISSPFSEKFRVQLDVAGFNPDTIGTRIEGRKVIVEARQEDRQPGGDFNLREIRKTYDLPEFADTNNLASFVTPDKKLVIEVPVYAPRRENRLSQGFPDSRALSLFGQFRDPTFDYPGFLSSNEFRPRIVDIGNGQRQIKMSLPVKNYRPEQIKVSIKNNQLLVQAENIYNDSNNSERSFLTKSTTLPPGTQVDYLQTYLSPDGQLEVEAPFVEPTQTSQMRPIEVQRVF